MAIINKPVRIGIIAIFTILLAIWGFHFLKGSNLLDRDQSYFAVYPKIDGLQESAPVTINGYKIGLVGDIRLAPNGHGLLLVEMSIRSDIRIPKGSIARIYSSDLMGSKSIALVMGDREGFFSAGDTLPSQLEPDLKEEVNAQVAPLKARIEKLMLSFDSVLVGFQEVFNENTRENLIESFQSITTTLNTINKTTLQLDELVTSEKGKLRDILSHVEGISGSINRNSSSLENAIRNLSSISDTLARANLAETVRKTNTVLGELALILEKVKNGEGSAGLLFKDEGLYRNLESASLRLSDLLADLKKNPKRYIHLSVFDFNRQGGGTQRSTQEFSGLESDSDCWYSVQLEASVEAFSKASFPDSLEIEETKEGAWFKYRTGHFALKSEASLFLQVLRKDYPDAFVVKNCGSARR